MPKINLPTFFPEDSSRVGITTFLLGSGEDRAADHDRVPARLGSQGVSRSARKYDECNAGQEPVLLTRSPNANKGKVCSVDRRSCWVLGSTQIPGTHGFPDNLH